MHPCAILLGEVLTLLRLEEEALDLEDLEQAEDLAQKRSELLEQAWKERDGYDVDLLRNTLMVIQAMQERLIEIASKIHGDLGAQLRKTKQHGKYFSENRYWQGEMQKSYYVSKTS